MQMAINSFLSCLILLRFFPYLLFKQYCGIYILEGSSSIFFILVLTVTSLFDTVTLKLRLARRFSKKRRMTVRE